MKKNIFLAIMLLTLVSCGVDQDNTTTPVQTEEVAQVESVELTGTAVIELSNPHHLAGETLIFDVEIVEITKGEENSEADTVEPGDAIEVHYTGTLEDGEKFDSSRDRGETLPFTVGAGQMISGFDSGVVGMKLGESQVLTLSPEEAYGPASFTQTIEASRLQEFADAGFEIAPGAVLPAQGGDVTIIELQN